ncbi:beta-ketoacyl-ACP synthase [Acidisphaera sp. S103]|uniref:beta-ketoacyl-ACP synthase n=1 Tax=Acidisphaera sp. S103 TaxID=1747223 RepID=UPI0020B17244|nr:beta-ketoacyl-ACP synthase [Acidisphaera sp. S103]
MRPLALTALGLATPLGCGKAATAVNLFSGSVAGLTERRDLLFDRAVTVGVVDAVLPSARPVESDCRNNRLMQLVLDEIAEPIAQAVQRYGSDRIAVVLGTSTSGIAEGGAAVERHRHTGVWPEGFSYRQQELGGLARHAAAYLGVTGPAYTVATACSSSAKAFASARRLIRAGVADAAVVGGADTLCRLTLNGFNAIEALSPTRCNPFSRNRDGITIGEGAAAFLLEPGDGPVRLLGIGETSDAYHASAPAPDGAGAAAAMRQALADAGLSPDDIGYVNLHGTGTVLNDAMESHAMASVFGRLVPASSTKAMTGHMLGSAGACEAAFLWLTLSPVYNPERRLPPHLWDGMSMPDLPTLNLVAIGDRLPPGGRMAVLSNSFAFAGSNATLVLGQGEVA